LPTERATGLGYSVFACLVATGRFAGDYMKSRFGAVAIARACGCAALAGLLIVLFAARSTFMALVGFGCNRDRRIRRLSPRRHGIGWSNGSACGGERRHPVIHRFESVSSSVPR
jgi:hypothetical protein